MITRYLVKLINMTTPAPVSININDDAICNGVQHLSDQHLILSNRIADGDSHILNQNSTNSAAIIARVTDASDSLKNLQTTSFSGLSNQVAALPGMMCEETAKVLAELSHSAQNIIQDVHGASDHVTGVVERLSVETRAGINNVNNNVLIGVRDIEKEILAAKCSVKKDVAEAKAASKLSVTKAKCELERQSADYKAHLDREILTNRYDSQKQFGQVQLEACNNRDIILRQLEKQSCEIKDRIETRYCDTVGLIKLEEEKRLKDEVAALRQRLLVAELSSKCCGSSSSGPGKNN